MRRTLILGVIVAAAASAGLFRVANEVRDLEARLGRLNRAIVAEQESIRILNAEWAYLNDPARIQKLVDEYLLLVPSDPVHMASLAAIPERAPTTDSVVPVPGRKPSFDGRGLLLANFRETGR